MDQLFFTVEKTIVLPPYPQKKPEKKKKDTGFICLAEVIAEIAKTIKERKEEGVHYQ